MKPQVEDGAWFLPKRYGYGAGWPIAWQGWTLIGAYLLVLGLCVSLAEWDAQVGLPVAVAIALPATTALAYVSARKTRGGWRWRWGDTD